MKYSSIGLLTLLTAPMNAESRQSKPTLKPMVESQSMDDQKKDDLKEKHCVPCEGKTKAFDAEEEKEYLFEVPQWSLNTNGTHTLMRRFIFKNFKQAMAFVNEVAEIAEIENHHPDIAIFYNNVTLEIHTHAIRGLSENDFILASKIDELLKSKAYRFM